MRGGTWKPGLLVVTRRFQSTRPVRGGTQAFGQHPFAQNISIHPPRAGRDDGTGSVKVDTWIFQSTRPVRGGTFVRSKFCMAHKTFQSTRPVRGGTLTITPISRHLQFQSTRPVRGGTSVDVKAVSPDLFQSTRPVRGGTPILSLFSLSDDISIHPPRAGRDITYQ